MCSPSPHPFTHWVRHIASVPKGFLRYYVLKLLSEEPMSGSEIMNAIEKRTDGHWKPSPGSIYPLLAWLQERGYTRELPKQESGVKRYSLTDKGKKFLDEHVKRRKILREKFGMFRPSFHWGPWLNFRQKDVKQLFESGKAFVAASWDLLDKLRETYSEEAARKAVRAIDEATEKLVEITQSVGKNS